MFDSWDYDYGRRIFRPCVPPRAVLVDLGAVLPGEIGLSPLADPRQLWLCGAGLHLPRTTPARQVAWCRQDIGTTWWAVIEVDLFSSNRMSRLPLRLIVQGDHFCLDTPDGRAKMDLPPQRAYSEEARPPR